MGSILSQKSWQSLLLSYNSQDYSLIDNVLLYLKQKSGYVGLGMWFGGRTVFFESMRT